MTNNVITIPYSPHKYQRILHEDTHRFKTIVCGRRFGKTIYAVNELLKWSTEQVGLYWYIAPQYNQAKRIAWILFRKYAHDIAFKWNESELTLTLLNGSIIMLAGADKPDSLRGVGLKGVVLDEFADFKNTVWDLVIRPMLTDSGGKAIFLGTPKGKMNNLYEMFIRDADYEDTSYRDVNGNPVKPNDDFKSFNFKTIDNPYISKKDVEKAREELSIAYFKQEYEGNFENYTGIVYKEFDVAKHIISYIKIEDWWNIYVGIDTGRRTAFTFLAMDDKGIGYVFDEIYDYDSQVSHIVQKVFKILQNNNINMNRVIWIIDSASQVKREYRANGIYCIDSKKDLLNQINQVRNKFSSDQLYFLEKCTHHRIEHQGYIWNENVREPVPIKENDHTCSALQYIYSTYRTIKSVDTEKIKAQQRTIRWAVEHNFEKRQKEGMS